MVQVSAGVAAARCASAGGIERTGVVLVLGVADLDVAVTGKEPTVAGITRGHHAVKHVDAARNAFNQILGRSHPHQITRLVFGHLVHDSIHDGKHLFFRFTNRQATQGVTVETDFLQARKRLFAQFREHAALNDAEKRVGIFEAIEFLTAAPGPTKRQTHRIGRFLFGRGTIADHVRRAFVKLHHDVGIQNLLNLHRDFRRQKELVAIDGRSKAHAFLRNLAQLTKAKHLETARVGQNRAIPVHEAMQPTVRGNDIKPRAKPKMKRIAEDDLTAHAFELVRRHRLDGTVGTHGHEHRRLHHTVIERHYAAARRSFCF